MSRTAAARRAWTRRRLAAGFLCALLAGCAVADGPSAGRDAAAPTGSTTQPTPSTQPTVDPEQPTSWGPTEGEVAHARELAAQMTRQERVSAVLMPGFWGYDARQPAPHEQAANRGMHGVDSPVEVLQKHGFGGVFLRPEVIGDARQVARLTGELREVADEPGGLPLLVSIDQEGGAVQRLAVGVDRVPSAAAVGSTGDLRYATQVARDNGRSLREVGVTMVMAPVADVDPAATSTMGSRTYASDHRMAADMVTATVKGYLDSGVLPVVKHFPGLGSVVGDSHSTLPVQRKTLDELLGTDLVPFRAAIKGGAPVVMSGHVAVEVVEPGVPASTSRGVIAGLLRSTLGFDGVVVTDSHGMGPIHGAFGSGEGAVRSLVAGNDIVLNSPNPIQARNAVLRALRTGRLAESQLEESVVRVLALRGYQQRLAATGSKAAGQAPPRG